MKSGYDYLEAAMWHNYSTSVQKAANQLKVDKLLLEVAYPLTSWFMIEGRWNYVPTF